jgi:tetratricopeptide (TPR) repeat protein
LYYASNHTQEALDLFEKVGQMDPNNPVCYLNIGQVSSRLGMFDKAQKAFLRAVALSPGQPVGYRELARLYLRANRDLPEARKLAEKAESLDEAADNYFVLGWACDLTGDPASALKAMERAVQLAPDNPQYKAVYERIKSRN